MRRNDEYRYKIRRETHAHQAVLIYPTPPDDVAFWDVMRATLPPMLLDSRERFDSEVVIAIVPLARDRVPMCPMFTLKTIRDISTETVVDYEGTTTRFADIEGLFQVKAVAQEALKQYAARLKPVIENVIYNWGNK